MTALVGRQLRAHAQDLRRRNRYDRRVRLDDLLSPARAVADAHALGRRFEVFVRDSRGGPRAAPPTDRPDPASPPARGTLRPPPAHRRTNIITTTAADSAERSTPVRASRTGARRVVHQRVPKARIEACDHVNSSRARTDSGIPLSERRDASQRARTTPRRLRQRGRHQKTASIGRSMRGEKRGRSTSQARSGGGRWRRPPSTSAWVRWTRRASGRFET